MPYLSKYGLLKVQNSKTYAFTPHDLNTQEMETLVYHKISQDIQYLLQAMLLISFKPLGIGRSYKLHAKFVVHDSSNYLELLKYGIS